MSQAQAQPAESGEKTQVGETKPKGPQGWRISLFNLPPGVTNKDELREFCKDCGPMTAVEFYPASSGPGKPKPPSGYVTFKTKTDADYAIYRLNGSSWGGKFPLKATLVKTEGERKTTGEGPVKKQKVKKPMTPLSTLTPKNYATPPPVAEQAAPGAAPQNPAVKKGWDSPAQGAPAQGNKGPRPNQKNPQGGPNPNKGQGKAKAPPQNGQANPNNVAPAQQPVQGTQPQNVAAPGAGTKNQPKKNNKKNAAAANPNAGQNTTVPTNQNQPQQVQTQPAPTSAPAPAQTLAQPAPANNQPAGQGKAKKARGGKNNQNQRTAAPAFTVNVIDPKTSLVLHVLELNQVQYNTHILPLVVKP